MSEPFRQTLISSTLNVNVESFEISWAQVAPRCPVPWSVRKYRLRGGKQEGVDIVEIDNGRFVMRAIPTRGMGIFDVTMDDIRLGWNSPVTEIVNPAYINLNSRGNTGWLDGFNEWLVRCGLEYFGAPGGETYHLAKGEVPALAITLHGKIANTPASELELVAETQPPYRLTLRGAVYETMQYGPKFAMATDIVAVPGEARFRVEDRVTNFGGQTQEFGLLYHVNYGRPILEPGAEFIAPVAEVWPRNAESAAAGVHQYHRYGKPVRGSAETVYLMKLLADRRGQTTVMLRNRKGDAGASMTYDTKSLPWFALWKAQHDERDGYVTGLEPCTYFPDPRPSERAAGRVPRLKPDETFVAAIEYGLHSGKKEVAAVARYIAGIQGSRKTKFMEQPKA
jgi:hypothetical protein